MVTRITLSVLVLCLALPVFTAPVQAQEMQYARVSHDNVRVRAGTADYNAEMIRLDRGDVVAVTGFEGDWARVRVPGGTVAYVKKGAGSRTYVEQPVSGQGRVVVGRLQLRPKPTMDWPSMGTLSPNQRLLVLAEVEGGWLRILAPEKFGVYVFKDYLDVASDQASLRTLFEERDAKERAKLLKGGDLSSAAIREEEQVAVLERRRAELDDELVRALDAQASRSDLAALRLRYEEIAASAPEGSEIAIAARDKASYIAGRERVAGQLEDAESRIAQLEKSIETNDAEYVGELEKFRDAKRGAESEKRPEETDTRFLQYGIGKVHKDLLKTATGVPTYVLTKGSEKRYLLVSKRYDLSEYVDKTIGVTGWNMAGSIFGEELRRVEVTRLEILR